MTKRRWALLFYVAGALILAHQIIWWGRIDWDQVMHHEFFAAVAMALGAGIMVGERNP